ncbi:hypothetical protein [Microbacterium sp. NPDC090014]|uniref:hypothetical protein n=1 Tax=Microbacterium sp. NPDC090014 TaxID=3364205 RepID=UPI00382D1DD9
MSTTPAQLSLELNLNQRRIRDEMLMLYGTLPEGVTRWELDDVQADAVRSRLGRRPEDLNPRIWTLEIGDTVQRHQLHAAYGGQQQSGIITPKSVRDILIVTHPGRGDRHGYGEYEGLQADGSFLYTGEGQYGNQRFVRGNRALRDAVQNDRPIRLFTKRGTEVTYVGEFTTGEPAYSVEKIRDSDWTLRDGIIFKLVPVDADTEALEPTSPAGAEEHQATEWTAPETSPYVVGAPSVIIDREVPRIEFELQRDFGNWVKGRSETPQRLRLRASGATIEPDMYVEESGWIVEAKKSPAREYVRTAIGQVLDYALLARETGRSAVPVVLLPSRPVAHLERLLSELGIILIVRDGTGFEIIE